MYTGHKRLTTAWFGQKGEGNLKFYVNEGRILVRDPEYVQKALAVIVEILGR